MGGKSRSTSKLDTMNSKPLPTITILGTGGTIASTATSSTALTGYTVTEGVASLLAAVPDIGNLANIRCKQLFNVDSRALTNTMLLKLAREVQRQIDDPAIDGVVITHGTDTLEETACFLDLTIRSKKPVVVVGAMRPGTALSADGPLNLYNAVLVASQVPARETGVLVVLNDSVHAARFVAKTSTSRVDAFTSLDHGCMGSVYNGQLRLFQLPLQGEMPKFSLSGVKSLPLVDIIYDHQQAGIHFYQASIESGVQGIVVAGTGNGSLSPQAEKGLKLAAKNKIACVRASRVPSGTVSASPDDVRNGFISSKALNPQKARILLLLALTTTNDRALLQSYFDAY